MKGKDKVLHLYVLNLKEYQFGKNQARKTSSMDEIRATRADESARSFLVIGTHLDKIKQEEECKIRQELENEGCLFEFYNMTENPRAEIMDLINSQISKE